MTDQELYDKWRRYAFSIAQRMARSYQLAQEDVEDIASSALLALLVQHTKIDFSNESMAFVYCRTIISNGALDALGGIRNQGLASNKNGLVNKSGITVTSLDAPIDEDENHSTLGDHVPDERVDTEGDLLAKESRREARCHVRQCLRKLTPEYQKLLTWRFGLDGNEPMTLAEIAAELGTSKQLVGQQVQRAMEKLRTKRHPV